jgi:RNA polymerase sigma-70 factor (ECF subfamily)
LAHIEVAQDIASEAFVSALETWPHRGIPDNPRAWLYAVAKNKARNYFQRQHTFAEKIRPQLMQSSVEEFDFDLSEENISDSLLKMMFAICHPTLPPEAQICLSLRILCGFGIEEIANALLSKKDTVNKRLFRAKEKLRSENIAIEFPAGADVENRLATVLTTLYLLFNEGYYSESHDEVIREDLCLEAMRLTHLLAEHALTARPAVKALLALMCFHASRLKARKSESGALILYQDQDESLWNQELIVRGADYFRQAAQGDQLSRYHLEAGIAYWHTIKEDTPEKWENILQLYNRLLQLAYSPVAALNRTYALAKANGKRAAIPEAEKLQLSNNQYYYVLLGELYHGVDKERAKMYLEKALVLAKTTRERQLIRSRIADVSGEFGD